MRIGRFIFWRRQRIGAAHSFLMFLNPFTRRPKTSLFQRRNNAPVFHDAYPIAIKTTGDSRLSQAFRDILVAAGMAEAHPNNYRAPKAQNGRSRRRQVSEITFHSLRHTATSLLKTAGVGEAVAMDIIGHNSKAISRHYTHVSSEAKRAALAKLPSVG